MNFANRYRNICRRLIAQLNQSRDNGADAAAQYAMTQAISAHGLKYPVQFYNFVYEQLSPLNHKLAILKSNAGNKPLAIRFDKFLDMLKYGEHPVQMPSAIDIALYADRMRSDLRAFDNLYRHYDVGEHFSISSSIGKKGRLLMNAVRSCRLTSCLEIGTAYGVSAFFIMEAQKQCEMEPRLTTIEGYSPQKEISSKFLGERYGDAVRLLHGGKRDLLHEISTSSSDQFDFIFHDGGHRGDDYVEDFETLVPVLRHEAIIIIDDIRWDEEGTGNQPTKKSIRSCHQGWLEIIQHQKVKCAVEVDDSIGIIRLE